ncbi:hypothetical protein ACRAWC_12645 [Leifsonia sp. L25]
MSVTLIHVDVKYSAAFPAAAVGGCSDAVKAIRIGSSPHADHATSDTNL